MSANTASAPKKGANKVQNKEVKNETTTTTNTNTTTTTKTNNNNNRDNNRSNNNNRDNNRDNKDNKSNNNNNSNGNRQYPEDPIVVAFEKKISGIIDQLKDHNVQTKKLRDEQLELAEKKKKIKEDIDSISSENKAILPLIEKNREQKKLIDQLIRDHEAKKNNLNEIIKNLPIKVNNSSSKASMLEEIEKKVQNIERRIENERDLLQQRYLLRELKEINSQKKSIDEYFEQKDLVQNHDAKIREQKLIRKDINDQIDKLLGPDRKKENNNTKSTGKDGEATPTATTSTSTTSESAIKPKGSTESTTAETTTNADGTTTTTEKKKRVIDPNSPLGKLYSARNACSDRSKEIYEILKGEHTKKKEVLEAQLKEEKEKKDQYIKERSVKRVEERKKRDEERKKRDEEYKAKKELEKEQKRLAEVPYEDEILVCEDLSRYLVTITPKETKVVDVSAQPIQSESVEGYTLLAKREKPTRGGKKSNAKSSPQAQQQAVTDNIRHSFDTIIAFEKISVSLPITFSDIAEAKNQVQAKLDNYKKLSTKAIEDREKQIADKKAAEDSKSSESSTTTTETQKVEVEAQ